MRESKSVCRHLCSELVFITRADRRGRQAMLANLEEIGEWFAEVLTECAFPRDSAVRIVSRSHQLEGVVEDCRRQQPLGFFVKVRLSPKSHWSERWFTPQHLLRFWSGTRSDIQPKVSPLKAASGY
jgi:hypothetical protein